MPRIEIPLRPFLLALGAILLVAGIWAALELRPKRQLERAFDKLVAAAENRDWKRVQEFIANDYSDAWGQNREEALEAAREIFGQFLVLEITPRDLEIDASSGAVRCRPAISGTGGPLAQMVIGYVERLQGPTTLSWRKESWLPWSWKLISAAPPEGAPDPFAG